MSDQHLQHGPTSLSAPLHGATLGQAVSRFWRKYATFSGRASRSEYWWTYLFTTVTTFVAAMLPALTLLIVLGPNETSDSPPPLTIAVVVIVLIYMLALIVPGLAILARRLHDAGFSAWFILLGLVPFGGIVLFVFTVLESKPEGARFDAQH
jgi:uncharacterized membrane protein YhaH (DUF805 family)